MTCPATLELQRDGRHSGEAACTLEGAHFPHKAHFAQTSGDWRTVTFKPGDTYETRRSDDEMPKMPAQKPSRSEQEVQSPTDLVAAVTSRFGPITWDLAATTANSVCPEHRHHYGPGSSAGQDALEQDWTALAGTLFLNPPYGTIVPWAKKCAESLAAVQRNPDRRDRHDWRICMLTPASVGSNWFADHVHRKALVLALRPRLVFQGHTEAYPRDLLLSVYGERAGFDCWSWRAR